MQTPAPRQQGWAVATNQAQPETDQPLLLGRYRTVETRGTGGFGEVRVCWDTRLDRKVAIKCMPLETAPGMGASTLSEALSEARITSRLTDQNIVTVHDFEVRGGTAYLIMEFVDGMTLAELMSRVEGGVLTYDECAHLLSSLASALDHAHAEGVLHLDIKPSNVFIDAQGNVKLGDFGMASLASAAGWEGARGGTVGYMPPEQLTGDYVDERTDVFALACVCYQALTGSCPFLAKDADASLKRIEKGARPLAKVEPELAGPVSDQIAEALSADPGRRPSTAGELARAVLPYLGDEAEGRASVADLLAQARGETGPADEVWNAAMRVGIAERYPWLPNATSRVVCAAVSGAVCLRCIPAIARLVGLNIVSMPLAAASTLVPAAFSAALPAAGGTFTTLVYVITLVTPGAYSPAFLVAALAGAVLYLWQTHVSPASRLSHAALLLGCATGSPVGSAALAGACLSPLPAAATSALGGVLAMFLTPALGSSDGASFVSAVGGIVMSGSSWLMAAGCAGASLACALISKRRSNAACAAAQVTCCAILIATLVFSARVENGGLWTTPSICDIAVALVCLILMSISIMTLGPVSDTWEDE